MQVKKFEARTMKEALEMVKAELGPDAIILSARDNNKSSDLSVTAASKSPRQCLTKTCSANDSWNHAFANRTAKFSGAALLSRKRTLSKRW